jgi:hypothetical protein
MHGAAIIVLLSLTREPSDAAVLDWKSHWTRASQEYAMAAGMA